MNNGKIFATIDESLEVTLTREIKNETNYSAVFIYHISPSHEIERNQPNGMGCITFRQPGELYSYIPGEIELNDTQVNQIVTFLMKTKFHAKLWLF